MFTFCVPTRNLKLKSSSRLFSDWLTQSGRGYWCPQSVPFRTIATYTILNFAVHFSLIWLPNRYWIKTQMSKIEPYKSLLLNILNTAEYTLLSYNCNKLYPICVRWKNSGEWKVLTFTWEFLFKKWAEKPNVYVIHNQRFVVMLSSCWNNTPLSNSFQIFMSNLCSFVTWCCVIWQHFTTNVSGTTH